MIEILFFHFSDEILTVATQIFGSLGIEKRDIRVGNSSHVLKEIYYDYSILGIKIKIEYNSYDYEDKYNYMLSLRRDVLSAVKSSDEIVEKLTIIVRELLIKNMSLEIAHEYESGKLHIYK